MSGLLISTVVLGVLLLAALGVILWQWRSGTNDYRDLLSMHEREARAHAALWHDLCELQRALSSPAAGVGPCLARLADAALLIAEDHEARANADARGLLEAVDWGIRQLQTSAVQSHSLLPGSIFPELQGLSSDRRERFSEAFSTLRARHPFDEYDI